MQFGRLDFVVTKEQCTDDADKIALIITTDLLNLFYVDYYYREEARCAIRSRLQRVNCAALRDVLAGIRQEQHFQ